MILYHLQELDIIVIAYIKNISLVYKKFKYKHEQVWQINFSILFLLGKLFGAFKEV